jgi:hypothetical protein
MRSVWSFWSPPYLAQTGRNWTTPLHHLLAWGISLSAAARHYRDTVLITDRYGKKLLIDELGLPFANVSTELERVHDADPAWWALGKLIAYGMQDGPFVHIDTDVFLWKALPTELETAPVFAQCPEFYPRFSHDATRIEASFSAGNTELPAEWQWAVSRDDGFIKEANCGIFGGARTDFIRYYAQLATDLILRPEYAEAWSRCGMKSNMTVEQFLLPACADFHRFHPTSPYRGVTVKHLFSCQGDAFNPGQASRAGYTHLLGESKLSPGVGKRLEERVKRDDPAYFRRCEKVAKSLV